MAVKNFILECVLEVWEGLVVEAYVCKFETMGSEVLMRVLEYLEKLLVYYCIHRTNTDNVAVLIEDYRKVFVTPV